MSGTDMRREKAGRVAEILRRVGTIILRYGLVFVLLLWGTAKWTPAEAAAVQPLIEHSPFLFWIYRILSIQRGSELIGCIEIILAVLIGVRRWSPQLSTIGSTASIGMFLVTLSFLITTPKLDPASQAFLIKDIFLLGAAFFTASEAWQAAMQNKSQRERDRTADSQALAAFHR
jgi:reactive chlorine resistance protein C